MKQFTHRTRISANIKDVSDFHKDPRALKRLTPPPVFVQLHQYEPVGENSKVDFTMWLGPIPVRWVSIHSSVDFQKGFTDTQVQGPFDYWVHEHQFIKIDDHTTEVVDRVTGRTSKSFFWGLISKFMWLNLPILFRYRGHIMRSELERGGS